MEIPYDKVRSPQESECGCAVFATDFAADMSSIASENVYGLLTRHGPTLKTIQNLSLASDQAGIQPLIGEFVKRVGLQHFGFAFQRKSQPIALPSTTAFLDFPAEWRSRYQTLSTASAASNDPVIRHVTQSGIPTPWDCRGKVMLTAPAIARSARDLLGSAGEHGLKAGVTIPMIAPRFNWGFLVVTTGETSYAADMVTRLPLITLFAHVLLAVVARQNVSEQPRAQVLTKRQKEVLKWCAVGKTSWEISQILHVSRSTVEFHLAQAGKQLKTFGRRATCLEALRQGLIEL